MQLHIRTLFILLIYLVICDSQLLRDNLEELGRTLSNNEGAIKETNELRDEYDFIVIGAGSGGSVVANRLTENPKWSVLLLEAGRQENFITDVPLMASLQSATAYNWGYKSEKLKTACLGLIDGRCNMARGKALGGTSVINFLLHTRGNRLDFDMWANLGNKGWSYPEILPYFIKSENCTFCKDIDDGFHGKDGYLNIEQPGYESPMLKLFLKAGQDLGYRNTDPNGRFGLGFSKVQATMKNGARCSAAKAFLRPVANRSNLHISTQSRVTRILIDPKTKHTYGVEFLKNRRKYSVRNKKEVILSAGALNSPHILMLSGVGPKSVLKKAKIPVIQDLKVGYNLQDHMAMSTLVFLVNDSVTVSDLTVQNPVDIYNYLVREHKFVLWKSSRTLFENITIVSVPCIPKERHTIHNCCSVGCLGKCKTCQLVMWTCPIFTQFYIFSDIFHRSNTLLAFFYAGYTIFHRTNSPCADESNGVGPYTIPGGAEALAFMKTKYSQNRNDDYPDIELVLGAGALNGDIFGSFRNLLGIPDNMFRKVYAPLIGRPAFGIATVLLTPKSRGRVLLKDSNPLHWPLLKPNYFEEEEDLATMVEGIKMAISIATSKHFQKYNTTINPIPFPGCEHISFGSDQYWTCAVRHVSTTLGHHVGTCKMGPRTDPEAVVDPELKVYGIKSLRVVDGSIMPNIVAGHTNAVIYMIGEKASDLIKDTWAIM